MNSHLRYITATVATLDPSIGGSDVIAFDGRPATTALVRLRLLQLEWDAHFAALIGIIALALLGSILVARNRLEEKAAFVSEPEPRHEEFMTDREKVRQLITENGGRMKQSKIVDSVDWSKAKVSRLLAELEDDGQITKLRLGRENLVCLPGHEPTASKSSERPKQE